MANHPLEEVQSCLSSPPANDSTDVQDESEWPEAIRVTVRQLRKASALNLHVRFDASKLAWIIRDTASRLEVAIDAASALSDFDAEQIGVCGAEQLLDAIGAKNKAN